jgi:hypothetical protein
VKCLKPILFSTTILLGACSIAPQTATGPDESSIRAAADTFIDALASGDQDQLRAATIVDADTDTRQIAHAVEEDTVLSRQLQSNLKSRFGQSDKIGSQVGTDDWVGIYRAVASYAPVLRAGDRARIGRQTQDGVLFLKQQNGQWKVELVPTLVAESGGRQRVHDPVVQYRFRTTAAASEWFLKRLAEGDFASYREYQRERDAFWVQYMALAISGEDPHDKLLSSLPPIPVEQPIFAADR